MNIFYLVNRNIIDNILAVVESYICILVINKNRRNKNYNIRTKRNKIVQKVIYRITSWLLRSCLSRNMLTNTLFLASGDIPYYTILLPYYDMLGVL